MQCIFVSGRSVQGNADGFILAPSAILQPPGGIKTKFSYFPAISAKNFILKPRQVTPLVLDSPCANSTTILKKNAKNAKQNTLHHNNFNFFFFF